MTTTKPECTNCENRQACVPFFLHEAAMTQKDRDNRRMMILCLALCATLIFVVVTLMDHRERRGAEPGDFEEEAD